MIESEKRKAVYLLYGEGMSIRKLASQLHLSRKSVRRIISEKGCSLQITRDDRKKVDPNLLGKLYTDCEGFIRRIHEKLQEEEGIEIGYSTLVRLVKSLGLDDSDNRKDHRDSQVPDKPGAEMQHDTSPYEREIGGKQLKIVGSSLYLRYSKMRYLKFYRHFNRFRMKCFFHEALHHFGYAAGTCIIDNTNLAVLHGTGSNAVMVPEMIAFAKSHGDFQWEAHFIGHSDRKGGVESGFWFVETNFFPGRTFESLEDLNVQAMEWVTKRIVLRPHSKTKLIPAQLFEFEKPHLKKLPPFVSPPVLLHERETDQYGYAAFDGNYYWIPGHGRGRVQIIQYSDKIQILRNREELAQYLLPVYGVKNERFKPAGIAAIRQNPNNCKRPTGAEENRLTAIDPSVGGYLQFISKAPLSSPKKYRLIRELYSLSLKLAPQLFIQTIQRAHRYTITDRDTIERMAVFLMRENDVQMESDCYVDEDIENNEIYREAAVSPFADMSKYDELLRSEDDVKKED